MQKFKAIKGRWQDTSEKHNERGNMLIDLANKNGCIHIAVHLTDMEDENDRIHYFLHKSVRYDGNLQLTEFWTDGKEIHMLCDEEIASGYDLCGITVNDFEIVE